MADGIVCAYYHDHSGAVTDSAVYVPDIETLNQVILRWENRGIRFAGLVHSHLAGQSTLSTSDTAYIRSVFDLLPEQIETLFFPIVIPAEGKIAAFAAKRHGKDVIIQPDEIHITP